LLAEQNEWQIERTKLLEEKQLMVFALESLTLKNNIKYQGKKGKGASGQTPHWVKPSVHFNAML
jgi:hypothetical protein